MTRLKSNNVQFKVILTVLILYLLISGKVYAEQVINHDTEMNAVFFYTSACLSCNEAQKSLENFQKIIGSEDENIHINIIMFNTYEKYGYDLLQKYFTHYNVPSDNRATPILFIGNEYYYGENAIEKGLKYQVSEIKKGNLPETLLLYLENEDINKAESEFSGIKAANVFLAGLVNGLNPCSISMLLFLISLLLVRNFSVLKMGLAYTTGKFVMYMLLGTVLFNLFSVLEINFYRIVLKIFIGIFFVIVIALYLRDFIKARKEKYEEIRMQLPLFLRKFNHKLIINFTSKDSPVLLIWLSFSLGLIISVGEFLCTGQIFMTTIIYVLKSNSIFSMRAFIYLLIYDIAFIIPLLILILVINRTREVFEVSEKIRGKLPLIKLITAGTFLILGVYIIMFNN